MEGVYLRGCMCRYKIVTLVNKEHYHQILNDALCIGVCKMYKKKKTKKKKKRMDILTTGPQSHMNDIYFYLFSLVFRCVKIEWPLLDITDHSPFTIRFKELLWATPYYFLDIRFLISLHLSLRFV